MRIFIIAIIVIICSCSPKLSKEYLQEMNAYQLKKNQEYLDNEYLNLTEDELSDYFPFNQLYNCDCKFIESKKPYGKATFMTAAGRPAYYLTLGSADCSIGNKDFSVTIYKPVKRVPGYKDYLFLPIKDLTSHVSTYGGGRYVELYESDIQGDRIHIDFNKLYNPYCAYRAGFACPIPPKENHLTIPIKAGMMYNNHH